MVITVLTITYVAVQFHIKRNKQKQAIEYIRNGAKSALVEAGLEILGINQNGKLFHAYPMQENLIMSLRCSKVEVKRKLFEWNWPSRWLLYRQGYIKINFMKVFEVSRSWFHLKKVFSNVKIIFGKVFYLPRSWTSNHIWKVFWLYLSSKKVWSSKFPKIENVTPSKAGDDESLESQLLNYVWDSNKPVS